MFHMFKIYLIGDSGLILCLCTVHLNKLSFMFRVGYFYITTVEVINFALLCTAKNVTNNPQILNSSNNNAV